MKRGLVNETNQNNSFVSGNRHKRQIALNILVSNKFIESSKVGIVSKGEVCFVMGVNEKVRFVSEVE